MATNAEIKREVEDLKNRLASLQSSNSRLFDEMAALKSNYSNLVEDMNARLEVVHNKIFRK
tara:strand:- start:17898 stop:18080 length:183 start_codon:yes stop_codon:yes gene_type:complete